MGYVAEPERVNRMRTTENFNNGWYFVKAADMAAAQTMEWEKVTLPHTWNNIDGQDGGNDYYRGTCLYRKGFHRPHFWKTGDRAFLEFNGAAMTASVEVNGKFLKTHDGGYSTFRVDITDVMEEENQIYVAVDNSANDRVYPQKADFTFYGGLYRDVNLICVPGSHFELEKDGTPGIKVTPVIKGKDAEVHVVTWVCGKAERVHFSIEGEMAMDAEVMDGKAEAVFLMRDVHLWNGVQDSFLYTAKAELFADGEIKDCIQTGFGCRSFSFDKEKGFILNGRPYPLRGVSRHQDRAGVGNALTREMHWEDMEIIKEMGANTIRLAHYQHDQYFYDLADEAGMVVWAEIPYITQHMENGRQNTLDQMRELITQCFNHPSIVCWGLSNEITASGNVTGDLMENHRLLNELCHQMDQTRPTTMAHVFMLETDSPLIDIADIGSYNLYFGWYLGELSQNDSFFDEYHDRFPNRSIGFSEYGADANPKYQSAAPERGDYSESYQCIYHEHLLDCIENRPYLWATHVWNMFDFAADGRDEGGAHGLNQKGLVTIDRKLKKDAFYLYKAAWSSEPFIHLCGNRYVDRSETVTDIKVYTNQPCVELYVDGKLLEKKEGKRAFGFKVLITGEHLIEAKSGSLSDGIRVCKVDRPNPEYQFAQEGGIINWFDKEDFKPGYYSVKDTMGVLQAHPEAGVIVGKKMEKARASRGDVAKSTQGNKNLQKMMAGMTLESILKQAKGAITAEQIKELNDALQQIRKAEIR